MRLSLGNVCQGRRVLRKERWSLREIDESYRGDIERLLQAKYQTASANSKQRLFFLTNAFARDSKLTWKFLLLAGQPRKLRWLVVFSKQQQGGVDFKTRQADASTKEYCTLDVLTTGHEKCEAEWSRIGVKVS
jgi:hypothetical protein